MVVVVLVAVVPFSLLVYLRCSVLPRQNELVSCPDQIKDRACSTRNIFLNKFKRRLTLQLAFQTLVNVIAFWRHKMGLNTL